MSKEIAWLDGWTASAEGDERDSNPHPKLEGANDQLVSVRFSLSMRAAWFAGWDDASAGYSNSWEDRLERSGEP